MLWIKRNLFLAVGGITAIVLLGLGIYLLLANVGKNKGVETELEEQKAHLESLFTIQAFPNATNIALARQETKRLRDAIAQTKQHFTPVASEKVTGLAFKSLLDNTIYELHRKAEQASVGLPSRTYSFTFEAQRPQVNFAAGSFPALPEQLAEIKAICHILFDARVNRLVNLRRVRISTDDPPGVNDYHDLKIETNETVRVVTSPYEATFQCFSAELATVLESFYKSPHGFIVKNIMVDTVVEVAQPPKAGPAAPALRTGGRPPPANTNLLETVLNEKLLKVTLLIEVVKPLS